MTKHTLYTVLAALTIGATLAPNIASAHYYKWQCPDSGTLVEHPSQCQRPTAPKPLATGVEANTPIVDKLVSKTTRNCPGGAAPISDERFGCAKPKARVSV